MENQSGSNFGSNMFLILAQHANGQHLAQYCNNFQFLEVEISVLVESKP